MSISLISLPLTGSGFTAFLISLFLFTKFSRCAYLFRPNFVLVVWESLMVLINEETMSDISFLLSPFFCFLPCFYQEQ